ncbi:tetratricopeptide repeat protein [Hyunsoonleella rubra]|uniref:Tetratricopeptide repeat protein n=1 Tax=Hyunsoonleella rubra TaxID=1737062 RepID=A0ABW5TAN2_9FLAO
MGCSLSSVAQNKSDTEIDYLLQRLKSSKKDTVRVEILDNLWYQFAYNEPKQAVDYAKMAISESKELNYGYGIARGYQRLGIAYSNMSKYDSSNIAYDQSLKLFEKANNVNSMGLILHNKAINFKDLVQYDSAMYYNDLAYEKYIEANDTVRIADIYGLRGSIYSEQGQFLLSLKNTLKEASIYKNKDTLRYADALLSLAMVQSITGSSAEARKSFRNCIAIYRTKNDNYFLCKAYRELGYDYGKNAPKHIDSASFYLENAVKLAKTINNTGMEVAALSFLGDLKFDIGKYTEAKTHYINGLRRSSTLDNHISVASILLGLSDISIYEKSYEKAKTYAQQALDIASRDNLNQDISEAYKTLHKIHQETGDFKKALYYLEKHKSISDSIYNIEKTNKINELQVLFDIEKKEAALDLQQKTIQNLNQKVEIGTLKKGLYAFGMFAFIALSILLYLVFKQNIRKNRLEREKQEAIYKQKLEFKKKELASQTLHLVQKNTFIQELKENLEKIEESPELFKMVFRRLAMLLKKENAEDKDWEVFKSYFIEVHNNFDQKIKSIYPEISEKEMRLASFLRMNLSTKEIASMLNVLPDSVSKSKYRLKKKLNLDKNTDLFQFLSEL